MQRFKFLVPFAVLFAWMVATAYTISSVEQLAVSTLPVIVAPATGVRSPSPVLPVALVYSTTVTTRG